MRSLPGLRTPLTLVLLFSVGLGLLAAGQPLLRQVRFDLTQDRLYTLSEGTRTILAGLEQPLELLFFYSEDRLRDAPSMRNYALRVRNLLDELAAHAGGALRVRIIDPEPYSEEEDRAAALGVQAIPLEVGGDPLYLGLAALGAGEREEVIPFFHPSRAEMLEYDILKAIYLASLPTAPRLALISGLPVAGGIDLASRSVRKPWTAVQQLKQFYDVTELDGDYTQLGAGIDLLLVIHPAALEERALFAIDQYVLGGGGAMVFVDPYAESAPSRPVASGSDPQRRYYSALPDLLGAWGVAMEADRVLGDAGHALLMNLGDDRPPVRNPTLLSFTVANLAIGNPITRNLESVNVSTAGVIKPLAGAGSRWNPLVWSSRAADLLDLETVATVSDPGALFEQFLPDGTQHAVAGLLTGRARSAFPEGLAGLEGHRSEGEVRVLVVADTDLLTDRLWVQQKSFFGQRVLSPFADNGALLVNAADYLAGSPDLIAIRSRGVAERSFTRVHALRREAEARHRATVEDLNQRLEETERELQRLGQMQADGAGAGLRLASPGQQATVDRFIAQKIALRRALREVQRQLNSDIESLGNALRLLNIALVPALLTALWGLLAYRRRRWSA